MLESLPGWEQENNSLSKEFVFKDFKAAFHFMTQVAEVAEAQNHHPDWSNSYNKVSVRLSTHEAESVTDKDIRLAEAIEEIYTSLTD